MYIFDEDNLALSAAIVAALQIIGFILICCLQLEQVAHVTGGLSFIAVAMFTLFMTKASDVTSVLPHIYCISPLAVPAKLSNLNFHPPKVVSCCSETGLQI